MTEMLQNVFLQAGWRTPFLSSKQQCQSTEGPAVAIPKVLPWIPGPIRSNSGKVGCLTKTESSGRMLEMCSPCIVKWYNSHPYNVNISMSLWQHRNLSTLRHLWCVPNHNHLTSHKTLSYIHIHYKGTQRNSQSNITTYGFSSSSLLSFEQFL